MIIDIIRVFAPPQLQICIVYMPSISTFFDDRIYGTLMRFRGTFHVLNAQATHTVILSLPVFYMHQTIPGRILFACCQKEILVREKISLDSENLIIFSGTNTTKKIS